MVKPDIHFTPHTVQFSLFTAEDIKKMCIMQIITPLMLDPLGHPIPGGLYDKRLGTYVLNFLDIFYCKISFKVHCLTNQIYVKHVTKL